MRNSGVPGNSRNSENPGKTCHLKKSVVVGISGKTSATANWLKCPFAQGGSGVWLKPQGALKGFWRVLEARLEASLV